ncbi:MAG: hypothetical protein NZ585_14580 [Chloracidobacterium sp.]|nr:hypothetical protein [Chloracidobacterium sp.]MDW8216043.1 hypothetical protein [Acidobacteriota bacterium]
MNAQLSSMLLKSSASVRHARQPIAGQYFAARYRSWTMWFLGFLGGIAAFNGLLLSPYAAPPLWAAQTPEPVLGTTAYGFSTTAPPVRAADIEARVREAYRQNREVDDVAAEIDQRGINFEMTEAFGRKMRFLRAAQVESALWRADERRRAVVARPQRPAALPADDPNVPLYREEQPFIEQVRAVTKAYVSSLPDFTARQRVQRYYRVGGAPWRLGDYLEIAVAYSAEKGERLELKLHNGVSTVLGLEEVGGLTSTGQFAGLLKSLFDDESQTQFRDAGTADFYGRICRVFAYMVETAHSRQSIQVGKARTIAGYRGRLLVEPETRRIVRLESECIDLPRDFPVSEAVSVVEFGWVTIGDNDYLMPVAARVALTDRKEGIVSLNCITFQKYGKFETTVVVE